MQTLEPIGQKSIEWAAGLFEGEGSIYRHSPTSATYYTEVAMTDKDVLEDFHKIVEVGTLKGPYHKPSMKSHHKPYFKWKAGKQKDVTKFLISILPYLGHRRVEKALEVFRLWGVDYAIN